MVRISDLPPFVGPIDPVNDEFPIVNDSDVETQRIDRNSFLNLTSQPVGLTDSQTLTNKTLTAPSLSSPVLSGTITGTYTLGGTPTFPASLVTLTGTQTLTNKTLTAPIINNGSITGTTITVDAIAGQSSPTSGTIYGVGITSAKISGASLTNASVTVTQLADSAVTPAKVLTGTGSSWVWQSWSPTITGYLTVPTGTSYTYTRIGKTVILQISEATNGTSNATSKTYSLPVAARTLTNAAWNGTARVVDNGSTVTTATLVQVASAGTALNVYATGGGGNWTSSGNARIINAFIIYESV